MANRRSRTYPRAIRLAGSIDEFCKRMEGQATASLFIAARQPSKGGEVQTFAYVDTYILRRTLTDRSLAGQHAAQRVVRGDRPALGRDKGAVFCVGVWGGYDLV